MLERWEANATTDVPQLIRWWRSHPDRNVGIACGPAGLVVIDLDPVRGVLPATWPGPDVQHGRHALALLAQWAGESDPVDTYTVITPRGEHRYFLAPGDRRLRGTIGLLGPGIDTRAWGSTVVAEGSVIRVGGELRLYRRDESRPDKPAPLPQWLLDTLTPPPPRTAEPVRIAAGTRLDAYVAAAVQRERAAVAAAQPGMRAITAFRSAAALGGLVGAGVLDEEVAERALLSAASVHDGIDEWTPREARRHVRNGLRRGMQTPRRIDLRAS